VAAAVPVADDSVPICFLLVIYFAFVDGSIFLILKDFLFFWLRGKIS